MISKRFEMPIAPMELRPFEETDFEAYPKVKHERPLIGEIAVVVGKATFDGLLIVDTNSVFIDVHRVTENGVTVKFGERVIKDMYLKADTPDYEVGMLLAQCLLNTVPLDYLQQKGFRHV